MVRLALLLEDQLSRISTREDLQGILDFIYTKKERRPSLKAIVVLTRLHPSRLPELIEGEKRLKNRYKVKMKKLEAGLFHATITKTMHARGRVSGQAIIDATEDSWTILTMGKHYFVQVAIERLLNSLYPDITRVYMNHVQLVRTIERVRNLYHGEEILTHFAIHREEKTGRGFHIQRSTLSGIGAEKELEVEAEKRRIWVDELRFRVLNEAGWTVLDCLLTSRGLIRLIFGNFTDFQEKVLGSILDTARSLDVAYRRVRREIEEDDVKILPCTIAYPDTFQIDHFKRLTTKLGHHYLLSVVHSGNPYYAVYLLDHKDGSSFGMTILGNAITISPMLRTTNTSLWRLTEEIQTLLGEGEVKVAEFAQ